MMRTGLLVLVAIAGAPGCVGMASLPETFQAAGRGSLVIGVTVGAPARRIAAVAADVDHVVVEVMPRKYYPNSPDERDAGMVKRLDKATLVAGSASVVFSALAGNMWEIKLSAVDAGGRTIGTAFQEVNLEPGQTKQVSMRLELEPTPSSSGVGGLTPSFTFTSPLPTTGTVTLSQTKGQWAQSGLGFDSTGAMCYAQMQNQVNRIWGYSRYDADGVRLGMVQFQPSPTGNSAVIDASGRTWVFGDGTLAQYGVTGNEIWKVTVPSAYARVKQFDPAGNLWLQSSSTEITRIAPDGTILGRHALLAGDESTELMRNHGLIFHPQSGDGWILSASRLLKVSSLGAKLLTVTFPLPAKPNELETRLTASALDLNGNVWVTREDGQLFKVGADGQIKGQYASPFNVGWLLTDRNGHLWAASATNAEMNLTKYSTDGVPIGLNGSRHLPADVRLGPDGAIWSFSGYDPQIPANQTPQITRLTP